MNTSCKATFKNGPSKEFSSIEEASKETGLSVASIKIRCNKPGTGGKDKTTFELKWYETREKKKKKMAKLLVFSGAMYAGEPKDQSGVYEIKK